jgi:hypothetical protein
MTGCSPDPPVLVCNENGAYKIQSKLPRSDIGLCNNHGPIVLLSTRVRNCDDVCWWAPETKQSAVFSILIFLCAIEFAGPTSPLDAGGATSPALSLGAYVIVITNASTKSPPYNARGKFSPRQPISGALSHCLAPLNPRRPSPSRRKADPEVVRGRYRSLLAHMIHSHSVSVRPVAIDVCLIGISAEE